MSILGQLYLATITTFPWNLRVSGIIGTPAYISGVRLSCQKISGGANLKYLVQLPRDTLWDNPRISQVQPPTHAPQPYLNLRYPRNGRGIPQKPNTLCLAIVDMFISVGRFPPKKYHYYQLAHVKILGKSSLLKVNYNWSSQ